MINKCDKVPSLEGKGNNEFSGYIKAAGLSTIWKIIVYFPKVSVWGW